MISLIDTHCHLDFAAFDADIDDVIKACEAERVHDIVVPAVSQSQWHKTIAFCQNSGAVARHLALGLHPIFIEQHQPQHLLELEELIQRHQPVALGEIGLDFFIKDDDRRPVEKDKQILYFTKQLIIAKQTDLPVIVHVRKAHDECVRLLSDVQLKGGFIHNFSGSIQHAKKYIDLGFKLGFGGMLTFERSRVIRSLAKQIPLESIVLETDSPDLAVSAHQGQRNSPEYLPHVLNSLASIKQEPAEYVAKITTQNAKQILSLNE